MEYIAKILTRISMRLLVISNKLDKNSFQKFVDETINKLKNDR